MQKTSDMSRSVAPPRLHRWQILRLIRCVRFDEVIVLQGAPVFGAMFAFHDLSLGSFAVFFTLFATNILLVAHVFVLNDWAGIEGDDKDPHRTTQTFLARGVERRAMAGLAVALLLSSLLLALNLGMPAFLLTLGIACLSALYSLPIIHGKGIPLCNSLLHFVGGLLHFLLGYAAFSNIGARGVAIGCFFAIIFAAGHLTHETRDCDADKLSGIRTNAVTFGKSPCFIASLVLFSTGYAVLAALSLYEIIPWILLVCCGFYPFHLLSSVRAIRSGLTFNVLRQHQGRYRLHFSAIGTCMLVATVLSKLRS